MADGKAEFVWYPASDDGSRDDWLLCQLLARTPAGGATLKPLKKPEIVASPEDAKLICPRPGQAAQNLASLARDGLGPETVEDAIRNQFCNQLPYTNINDITLCVNPFRELTIYSETWIDKYSELDPSLPPHIYNAAAKAYSRSMAEKESQVLQLVGDSCSGKSRAFEHVLSFLGQTAGDGDEELKQLLGVLRPLKSVMCHCGRDRHWLSTRALFEVDLGLGPDGFICRTTASLRLLEGCRVARQEETENGNFDALYLATKAESGKEWLGEALEFRLLGDEAELEDYDESGRATEAWMEAMSAFNIDSSEVVRVLCGLILLGEVRFNGKASLTCEPEGAVDNAAKALGVASGQLLAALVGGASKPEDAACELDAALEDLYRRLVAWVLRAANAHTIGDSKAMGQSIRVVEVPSRPQETHAPQGFDGLALQWLAEAVFANVLKLAGEDTSGNAAEQAAAQLEDLSEQQAAAEAALETIAGAEGIGAAFRAGTGGSGAELLKRLGDWASTAQRSGGSFVASEDGESSEVIGACGQVHHFLGRRLAVGASGTRTSPELLGVLSKSTCKCLAEITSDAFPRPAAGVSAAEEAIDTVKESFRRPNSAFHSWLVCCMRPNEKGVADTVSRPLLLEQVNRLRLAEAVHLAAESSYSIIWPLKAFRARYAELAPTLEASMGDEEACRLLVKSAGGDEGTVGSANVFGGVILQQLMDHKLEERAAGDKNLKGTKEEMKQLVEDKVGRLQQEQLLQGKQQAEQLEEERREQRAAQERAQQELEALRGQQLDQSLQQQQLLHQLQGQQEELQRQQQDQMEKLRQQQQADLERLQKQQEEAAASAQQALLEAAASAQQVLSAAVSQASVEQRSQGSASAGGLSSSRAQRFTRLERAPRFDASLGVNAEEPPPESRKSHPALHAALAQMAAILRVSKDREQRFAELKGSHERNVKDMHAECDLWRQEVSCLSSQVGELQRSLQDAASLRRTGSVAAPPGQVERPLDSSSANLGSAVSSQG